MDNNYLGFIAKIIIIINTIIIVNLTITMSNLHYC